MNATKKRVHWSADERARFFQAARTFGAPESGDSVEVWRRAIEMAGVPPRPDNSADLAKMNAERRKGGVQPMLSAGAPAPAPAPAREAPPADDDEPSIASLLVDSLLRVLYDPQLRKALRDLVAEALAPEPELAKRQAITWQEPMLGQSPVPRVVIAGGNRALHAALAKTPGVDFRFWGSEKGESLHRLRALMQGASAAVLMVNAAPHSAMNLIKTHEKKGALTAIYWTRSSSELESSIKQIIKEGQS